MATPSNSTIISTSPTSKISSPTTSIPDTTTSLRSSPSTSSTPISTSHTSSSSSVDLTTSTTTTSQTPTHSSSSNTVAIVTSTSTHVVTGSSSSTSSTAAAAATSSSANLANPNSEGSTSSTPPSTIAVATVVPIVAVVLLVLAGIWFWRKRKDRKNAEEMRRKEMEEYGFNPNNDPTLPVSSVNGDEPSTIRENDAGYRGWGATSTTRKASTTMSSQPGMARSDSGGRGFTGHPSPPIGVAQSDGHSGDPLVRRNADDVAALGAAPAASTNRANGVNRGPSNASSAYSGANYSDVSADGPLPNGSPPQDYGGFTHPDDAGAHNPYGDGAWGQQPVIRDVSARRNTRIESPSVVHHQGNSGISQNF